MNYILVAVTQQNVVMILSVFPNLDVLIPDNTGCFKIFLSQSMSI